MKRRRASGRHIELTAGSSEEPKARKRLSAEIDDDAVAELARRPIVRSFGESPLRVFLFERGIEVREAAAAFQVKRRTLSTWLSGESRPNPAKAYAIATALGFQGVDADEQLFPLRKTGNTEEE